MRRKYLGTAYHRAKHRVERIRRFYTHLMIYVLVNIGISCFKIFKDLMRDNTFIEALLDQNNYGLWVLWGVFLAIHAFAVFGLPKLLGYDWEARQIQKFMNEEDKSRFS